MLIAYYYDKETTMASNMVFVNEQYAFDMTDYRKVSSIRELDPNKDIYLLCIISDDTCMRVKNFNCYGEPIELY